jgi:hypothetical protein
MCLYRMDVCFMGAYLMGVSPRHCRPQGTANCALFLFTFDENGKDTP